MREKKITIPTPAFTIESVGTNTIQARYDIEYPAIGITVDKDTNRITFDKNIYIITLIDEGGVEFPKVRLPFISPPLEVGVPPVNSHIRIKFRDLRGKPSTIYAL